MNSMPLFLFWLASILMRNVVSQSPSSECDMAKCNKERQILYDDEEMPRVTIQETDAVLLTWEEYEEVLYTWRRRFTAYCYQGTILDPNTGCDASDYEVPITKDQARKYATENICETGCECANKQCIGSSAACCLNDELSIKVGPKRLGNTMFETASLGYHSCTSRWGCTLRKLKLRPNVAWIKGETKRSVMVADKYHLNFDSKFYSEGVAFGDGARYYSMLSEPPKPRREKTKVRCYSSNIDNIACLLNLNGKEIPIKIDRYTLHGVLRNMALVITGEIKTIKEGKLISVWRDDTTNGMNGPIKETDDGERASSIESLNEVINGLKITQMQEIANVIANENRIIKVKNLLHRMIMFLSQKYPLLLSTLFGGNYRTKWLNERVFQTCPCTKKKRVPLHSNCLGNLIFRDGEMQHTEHPELECLSIDDSKLINMTLTDPGDSLDVETIDYLPPKSSSSDDQAWDWLVQERHKVSDYIEHSPREEGIKSLIESMVPVLTYRDIMLYFCFIMSLFYIAEKLFNRSR